jgi:hypothetical protein
LEIDGWPATFADARRAIDNSPTFFDDLDSALRLGISRFMIPPHHLRLLDQTQPIPDPVKEAVIVL